MRSDFESCKPQLFIRPLDSTSRFPRIVRYDSAHVIFACRTSQTATRLSLLLRQRQTV